MIAPILVFALAGGGALVLARRASAKTKKRKGSGNTKPVEPKLPGSGTSWFHAFYTLAVEVADSPGEPPFSWGVFQTAGLRSVGGDFHEAAAVGYELGLGSASSFADAVAQAEAWADLIRKPLGHGNAIATAIDGKLIVVRPETHPGSEHWPVARWIGTVVEESAFPDWQRGVLPAIGASSWQYVAKSQDDALGQAILYARTGGEQSIGVGARTANGDVEIVYPAGRCGAIAVGQARHGDRFMGGGSRGGMRTGARAPGWGGGGRRFMGPGVRRWIHAPIVRVGVPARLRARAWSRHLPVPSGFRAVPARPVELLQPGECGIYEGSGGSLWVCCKHHDGKTYSCGKLRTPGGGWGDPVWWVAPAGLVVGEVDVWGRSYSPRRVIRSL